MHSSPTRASSASARPLTWLGVTGLTLTAEYRFFGTLQPNLDSTLRNPITNVVVAGGKLSPDNYNHSVMLGLRYALFQPPPPPPPVAVAAPAAAPAPARTYLVFFDWDRADLTARAREIIAEAASNAGRVQATRIEVAGHADRSGTPAYNQRLSQRRADAVAAELVARASAAARSASPPMARAGRWCRPPTACASRRTAGSRSSCASRGARSSLRVGAPAAVTWPLLAPRVGDGRSRITRHGMA